jgi:putative ABC transport system substrate-binding protein
MSYGPSFPDQYRRAAELVDKILRGAKPADIPVEQPVRFVLVINLIVAKALGIDVPPMLLMVDHGPQRKILWRNIISASWGTADSFCSMRVFRSLTHSGR